MVWRRPPRTCWPTSEPALRTRPIPRFQSDLAQPGLRIPLTASATLFGEAVKLGKEPICLHTFGERFISVEEGRPAGPARRPLKAVDKKKIEADEGIVPWCPSRDNARPPGHRHHHRTMCITCHRAGAIGSVSSVLNARASASTWSSWVVPGKSRSSSRKARFHGARTISTCPASTWLAT